MINPMNQTNHPTPSLWQRLTAPHSSIQDIGEKRRASLIASISLVLFPLMVSALSLGMSQKGTIAAGVLAVVFAVVYFLARTPYYRLGSGLFIMILIAATIYLALNETAPILSDIFYSLFPLMFILGIALFNQRGMWILFGITMAAIAIIVSAVLGIEEGIIYQSFGITASIAILAIIVVRFRDIVEKDRLNELSTINKELNQIKNNLEQRVMQRTSELNESTRELEEANTVNLRRAKQFEAITRVASDISSTQNLGELLPRICTAINEQFNYYHAGIFLNDEKNEYSHLRAANSSGGQKMLARGHKLKIGSQGIVGFVTGTGNPRIALNVGTDSVYFNNPDLPETRSEMAIPLKIASKTIGALDVQSTDVGAFKTEDIASLSILADQVSIAINNARLYEATVQSLEQSRTQYRRYIKNEWAQLTEEEELRGYRFTGGTSAPLENLVDLGEAGLAVKEGKLFQRDGQQASDTAELAIPVRLRGAVIGVLNVSIAGRRQWSDDEIDIAEAVSERLALALENARLFQETNRRAERERIVSDISSKISGNIRLESLLETTAQELSEALRGSEVMIQLQPLNPAGGQA